VLALIHPDVSIAAPGSRAHPLAPFDEAIQEFMTARKVPGAAFALVRNHRLIHARGYGLADRARRRMVWPTTLFRLASLSKPITATSILFLAQQGRLDLDLPVLCLPGIRPASDRACPRPMDPRLDRITVRQLLHHTGGWRHTGADDPMFQASRIARALGVPSPPSVRQILDYELCQPLTFDPGSRYAYSNFGYALLGRVIESVTGLPYEKFVRQHVLDPAGIREMRLGSSLPECRHPREVQYHTRGDQRLPSVFPGFTDPVPAPYGSFCLEAMDAHGGWIGSAVEFARFLVTLDHPRNAILNPDFQATMLAPPPPPAWRTESGSLRDHYYACGWLVRPVRNSGKVNSWHAGSLPGSHTLAVRRHDGLTWVILFNQRSRDPDLPDAAIDSSLHRAAAAVSRWPSHDLFPDHLGRVPHPG
jgi:CubicO group peptidase (beta-lactamase class C family)